MLFSVVRCTRPQTSRALLGAFVLWLCSIAGHAWASRVAMCRIQYSALWLQVEATGITPCSGRWTASLLAALEQRVCDRNSPCSTMQYSIAYGRPLRFRFRVWVQPCIQSAEMPSRLDANQACMTSFEGSALPCRSWHPSQMRLPTLTRRPRQSSREPSRRALGMWAPSKRSETLVRQRLLCPARHAVFAWK